MRIERRPRDRSFRGRLAGLLARMALAAATAACVALALQGQHDAAGASLRLVEGTLSQSNSLDGAAILSAHEMKPGDTTTGTVTIANDGSLAGDFSLSSFDVTDVPGPRGGLLSAVLLAEVTDVTDAGAPKLVYSGALGAMPNRALGSFAPGEAHTYRFRVTLPEVAIGLNDVQGGSVAIGYRWLSEGNGGDPEPPPTGTTPESTTPPPPTGTVPPPTGTTPPPARRAPSLKLRAPRTWSARRRGNPAVTATCARACALRASVRTKGLPRKLRLKVRSRPMASRSRRSMRFTIVLSKRLRAEMRRMALRHRYAAIVVSVTATDSSGLATTKSRTIRVTR